MPIEGGGHRRHVSASFSCDPGSLMARGKWKHVIKNIKSVFKMQATSLLPQSPCPQNRSDCVYLFPSTIINGSWVQRVDHFLHSRATVEGDELDPKPEDTRQGSACPVAKVSLCCWAI